MTDDLTFSPSHARNFFLQGAGLSLPKKSSVRVSQATITLKPVIPFVPSLNRVPAHDISAAARTPSAAESDFEAMTVPIIVSKHSHPSSQPPPQQDAQEANEKVERHEPATLSDSSDVETKQRKPLHFYFGFIGICLVAFVFALDATTLAVAIPVIAEDLDGSTLQAFWASISYLLCVVISQPLYTTVSDNIGRKPPLYTAFVLFAVGSVAFAVAQNMTTVIVGRVLQGLGGGGMDLIAEAVVTDMTTLQERSLYLGLQALPIAIGSVLGPSLGAILRSFASWRWIGWINLPFLGVAAVLCVFFLRLRPIDSSFLSKIKRIDWIGVVLCLAGVTIFVLPISWANSLYPWSSWRTYVPLIIGAIILAAFALYEYKWADNPIFPARIFYPRTAKVTLLGNFVYGAILYSPLQYLPFFLQAAKLETVIGSAVKLIPTSLMSVIFAGAGVVIVGVVNKGYRFTNIIFWAILTLGTGILGLMGIDMSQSKAMGLPIIWGAAVGALMRLLHLPMHASVVDADDMGLAVGMSMVFRLSGGLVGLALSSTIFISVFESSIAGVELPGALATLHNANNAIGFIPQLRMLNVDPATLAPVLEAYAEAMRATFYTMAGFGLVGLVTAVFTEELTLERTDMGRQQLEH